MLPRLLRCAPGPTGSTPHARVLRGHVSSEDALRWIASLSPCARNCALALGTPPCMRSQPPPLALSAQPHLPFQAGSCALSYTQARPPQSVSTNAPRCRCACRAVLHSYIYAVCNAIDAPPDPWTPHVRNGSPAPGLARVGPAPTRYLRLDAPRPTPRPHPAVRACGARLRHRLSVPTQA
jgi:hypothetical protein